MQLRVVIVYQLFKLYGALRIWTDLCFLTCVAPKSRGSSMKCIIGRGCLALNFGRKRLVKLALTSSTCVGGHVGFDAYADLHRSQRS